MSIGLSSSNPIISF